MRFPAIAFLFRTRVEKSHRKWHGGERNQIRFRSGIQPNWHNGEQNKWHNGHRNTTQPTGTVSAKCLAQHHRNGWHNGERIIYIALTKRCKQAGEVLDLKLLDHVIITKEGYYSFADEGMI